MTLHKKSNHSSFADQLIKESLGLERLRNVLDETSNHLIHVPTVYSVSEDSLCLNAINSRPATNDLMSHLGTGLAHLHSQKHECFGLDYDNYIGLAPQSNDWSNNWGEFFIEHRLAFQIQRIKNTLIAKHFTASLKESGTRLSQFLNQNCDYASLLHGDLWSGNVMFDANRVWLIDPAIYHGDREVDLAMTELFGGFSKDFYQAYDKVLPRSKTYPMKRTIYNLYHYLNHYNLFGEDYLKKCYAGFDAISNINI